MGEGVCKRLDVLKQDVGDGGVWCLEWRNGTRVESLPGEKQDEWGGKK